MHTKRDAYKNMNMNTDTFKKHVNTKKYIGTYAYIKKLTYECRCKKHVFHKYTQTYVYTHRCTSKYPTMHTRTHAENHLVSLAYT